MVFSASDFDGHTNPVDSESNIDASQRQPLIMWNRASGSPLNNSAYRGSQWDKQSNNLRIINGFLGSRVLEIILFIRKTVQVITSR
jgi:hypothetical protein